ncbi:MAG TPA: NAD-dependent epimerase/dehydratase family protein, partial [Solirubrobacterales bacterium]|nr:NAD-dependent epimerase/dehydratase family protein [Solirubrobacterales bacterium]
EGWGEAVAGCDYVLHVASPFPSAQPKDADELIVPAREGTLRVLRAALGAGVGRVVITSSVAAIAGGARGPGPLTEADWTDLDFPGLSPYVRSKTIAEQAAWKLVEEEGAKERLATVNPGAILGPLLAADPSFSLDAVRRLLKGTPGTPRIGFSFVDVRDVADLHVRAMLAPTAGGERFIAASEFLWMAEIAAILREELGADAGRVPTRQVPNLLVRAMGLFDPGVRSIVSGLGKKLTFSSEKAQTSLGWSPRPARESVLDTARSLIELDLV